MFDMLNSLVDLVFGAVERSSGLIIPLLLILPVTLLVLHLLWWIRRPGEWQRVAKAEGFHYHHSDASLRRNLAHIQGLSIPRGEVRCLNPITREIDGTWECVFDHSSGMRRKGATTNRTVFVGRAKDLGLPKFRLLQRRFRRGSDREVRFEYDPDFSRLFTLEASDLETVRQFFDHKVREHFKYLIRQCQELETRSNRGLTQLIVRLTTAVWIFEVEADDDSIVIYLSRYIQPDSAPEFLKLCEQTLHVLREAAKDQRLAGKTTLTMDSNS